MSASTASGYFTRVYIFVKFNQVYVLRRFNQAYILCEVQPAYVLVEVQPCLVLFKQDTSFSAMKAGITSVTLQVFP